MADLSLANGSFDFSKLEERYKHFFAPALSISIDGTDITSLGIVVDSVTYESNVEEADSFGFRVSNAFDIISRDFKQDWIDSYLVKDANVEISMGYVDKFETMMSGVVTQLEFNFSEGDAATIYVKGMDRSFYMMSGNGVESWKNMKHSQIVSKIIGLYGLQEGEIEDTGDIIEKETQGRGESDFLLIKRLAEENGFEFFVIGKKVYFRQSNDSTDASPNLTLTLGKGLLSFDATVNIDNNMVTKVVMTRDDVENKQKFKGESSDTDKYTGGNMSSVQILTQKCTKKPIYNEEARTIISNEDAAQKAKSTLNKRSEDLVTGSATTVGLPEIRAGLYIKIEGVGERLSKLYYVTKATHTFDTNGYWTNFSFRGNAV